MNAAYNDIFSKFIENFNLTRKKKFNYYRVSIKLIAVKRKTLMIIVNRCFLSFSLLKNIKTHHESMHLRLFGAIFRLIFQPKIIKS
jgi:hypothetical protein